MIRLLCLFGLLLGLLSHTASAEPARESLRLWHTAPVPALPEPFSSAKKPWIIREQPIAFDAHTIEILKDAGARPSPSIVVDLFEKIHAEIEITSTVSRINDSATIRGLLKPPTKGDFTLIINGNVVVGTFQIGHRLFKVEHVVNGHQRLIEVDPAKLPPD